ncbi:MAG: hydantoinase [Rhodospirillaceae bacterium]|nr:hydantoinase [Rhodospirillaceae bacterium]|tara:strand:+ start:542 stop:2647 length:2106 start_codon:yes stop_codon:yes gene_type:complete
MALNGEAVASESIVKRVAADIGGTFTDIAAITDKGELLTWKVPSTPPNFAHAVASGIDDLFSNKEIDLAHIEEILHGCTVATNAILEQKGAKTALITTRGFRDVLEIQRIRVPKLYDPLYQKPVPLVPRNLRFEIGERLTAEGKVLVSPDFEELGAIIERIKAAGTESIAVCFLHSFVNPVHEQLVGKILREKLPNCFVSLSIDVLPQKREYERTSTTVVNAYVGPPVREYLGTMIRQLRSIGVKGGLMVMQSSGGILDAASCLEKPAHIVECGPAAGVVGAEYIARKAGYKNVITLDMGGTTAKASVIENGELSLADEYEVGGGMSSSSALVGRGGYALKLPVIDIAEVGAGGGSIAWLDRAGSLKIGPESAGAIPGPACYGRGNEMPTVTDANLILGYLNQESLAGGSVPISRTLAEGAVNSKIAEPLNLDLLATAYGIHTVANAAMMRAVRAVTTYRGRDPRDFTLFAFGGAGGLHAVDLARTLRIKEVVIPLASGVFSAVGLLYSNLEVNETAPLLSLLSAMPRKKAEHIFKNLTTRITEVIGGNPKEIRFRRFADLRFQGQAYELTIPFEDDGLTKTGLVNLAARFESYHLARYGHAFSGEFPVELVNLRLVGIKETKTAKVKRSIADCEIREMTRMAYFGPDLGSVSARVITRFALTELPQKGPMIIEEYEGTAIVPPDCTARVDEQGNIIIALT